MNSRAPAPIIAKRILSLGEGRFSWLTAVSAAARPTAVVCRKLLLVVRRRPLLLADRGFGRRKADRSGLQEASSSRLKGHNFTCDIPSGSDFVEGPVPPTGIDLTSDIGRAS